MPCVFFGLDVEFRSERVTSFTAGVEEMLHAMNSGALGKDGNPPIVVTHYDPFPSRDGQSGRLELAIPVQMMGELGGCALLLSTVGYYSSYASVKRFAITRIDMRGPAAQRLGLLGPTNTFCEGDDVRLGALLKPRYETDKDRVRRFLEWAGTGGIRVASEDELSVHDCRQSVLTAAAERAKILRDQVEDSLYIVNLTLSPATALDIARDIARIDACGIMVNVVTMGFDIVREIKRAFPEVPVIANVIGRGMIAAGADFFIAEDVLCRLARLSGADAVYTGPFVGQIETDPERRLRLRNALAEEIVSEPSVECRPASAVMSGGLGLIEVYRNAQVYDGPMICLMGTYLTRLFEAGIKPAELQQCIEVVEQPLPDTEQAFRKAIKDNLAGTVSRNRLADTLRVLGIT